jgi:ABC-2 type transport system permease protein
MSVSDTALTTSDGELRVITPKQTVRQQLSDLWRYRELLVGLVRKELKVKYKDSVLGFLWSMLNPALYLVVYYVVFQIILGNGIPAFAIYLLSGLLVWNFFSTAIAGATGSVVANSSIVKKVAFPREILALASVGAALVHFFLQSIVLLGALAAFQRGPSWEFMPLIPVALVAVVLLAGAVGIFLSAANVPLRDTEHLVELSILVWFWMTPVVYPYLLVADKLAQHDIPSWLYRLNPVTPVVMTFQRVFYNRLTPPNTNGTGIVRILPDESILWYGGQLLAVIGVALVLFVLALKFFGRIQANFAEEL